MKRAEERLRSLVPKISILIRAMHPQEILSEVLTQKSPLGEERSFFNCYLEAV